MARKAPFLCLFLSMHLNSTNSVSLHGEPLLLSSHDKTIDHNAVLNDVTAIFIRGLE